MIKDGTFIGGNDLHSFLMIGQSNMAGRGDLADEEPIKNFRTYMMRNGRFIRMSEPINVDRAIFDGDTRSGASLAASFADELAKNDKTRIGLIPCADGGTSLEQWQPGGILYDNALFAAKLAMRNSTISGILWHQGESDCACDENIAIYKEKFIKMITSLRNDIGRPDLPLIIGELAHNYAERLEFSDRHLALNKIFAEIACELNNCIVVSSEGLTLKADGLHFDTKSLRVFGKRYFEAYKKLTEK